MSRYNFTHSIRISAFGAISTSVSKKLEKESTKFAHILLKRPPSDELEGPESEGP